MHECVVLHVCLDLSRSVCVSAGSHNLNPRTNPFRETGFTYASYVYVFIEVAQNFFTRNILKASCAVVQCR